MLRCFPHRTFSEMERLSSWATEDMIVKISSACASIGFAVKSGSDQTLHKNK